MNPIIERSSQGFGFILRGLDQSELNLVTLLVSQVVTKEGTASIPLVSRKLIRTEYKPICVSLFSHKFLLPIPVKSTIFREYVVHVFLPNGADIHVYKALVSAFQAYDLPPQIFEDVSLEYFNNRVTEIT